MREEPKRMKDEGMKRGKGERLKRDEGFFMGVLREGICLELMGLHLMEWGFICWNLI